MSSSDHCQFQIAHLSDPHLDGQQKPIERFRQVLARVHAMPRVDALVVCGDLADHGSADEYRSLCAELPVNIPTIVVPGNHDVRDQFEAHFGTRNSTIDLDGLRIVGLDSSIPDRDEGYLGDRTLEFATAAIASARGFVLLALHHPPVAIGHPPVDAQGLRNPASLEALVVSSPAVIGVLTGHVHTPHVAMFGGVPLIGAPGIVSSLRIDDLERISADRDAPPGFAVHRIVSNRLSSRFVALTPA